MTSKEFQVGIIHVCTYKISRDHDNKTGFYTVNVPRAGQLGIGFQVNISGILYGVSVFREIEGETTATWFIEGTEKNDGGVVDDTRDHS